MGRWISEDPIGFDSNESNLGRYVLNSPVNFIDRSGKIAEDSSETQGYPWYHPLSWPPFSWFVDTQDQIEDVAVLGTSAVEDGERSQSRFDRALRATEPPTSTIGHRWEHDGISDVLHRRYIISDDTRRGLTSAAALGMKATPAVSGLTFVGPPGHLVRLPKFKPKGKTTGVMKHGRGKQETINSGYDGPSAKLPKKTPGFNGHVKSHVEAHTAALMRQKNIKEAKLDINNEPCKSKVGCDRMLPRMLPPNAVLHVYGPNGYYKKFVGLAD